MRGPESDRPGELHFHYSREERENALGSLRKRTPQGFLARNRHLMMILVDILVLCVVFIFLLPQIMSGSRLLLGYRLDLRATVFDGTILASLKAENNGEAEEQDISLLFRVLPDGRESRVYGILDPQGENILRVRIPFRRGDEELEAVVTIGGEETSLIEPVSEE
jgi:hypothetical protein